MRLFDYVTPSYAPSFLNPIFGIIPSQQAVPGSALYGGYPAVPGFQAASEPPPLDGPSHPHRQSFRLAHDNLASFSAAHNPRLHIFALSPGASAHSEAFRLASCNARHRASSSEGGLPPWHPCYQPDRPLQAGFLRSILIPHLAHLRSLHLLRCSKVLDAEDYRAIGRLHDLSELTVESLVCLCGLIIITPSQESRERRGRCIVWFSVYVAPGLAVCQTSIVRSCHADR
jgi:hypothetical protein